MDRNIHLIKSTNININFSQIFWSGNDATGYDAMLVSPKKPGEMLNSATKSGITALEKSGWLSCHGQGKH